MKYDGLVRTKASGVSVRVKAVIVANIVLVGSGSGDGVEASASQLCFQSGQPC